MPSSASNLAERITGYDVERKRAQARRRNRLCRPSPPIPPRRSQDADLVILCSPVGAYKDLAAAIAPHLKPGAILSDVGSVKSAVVRDVAPFVPKGVHFIPAHPIAGTEYSGPEAGFASLFDQPLVHPHAAARRRCRRRVAKLKQFWEGCGSQVDVMDAAHHDLVLAMTSHVPHLIAYNIVGTAHDLEKVTEGEVIKYSAGGFRDFTRIAASDPTMWRDIFLNNREAVLEVLGRFNEDLSQLAARGARRQWRRAVRSFHPHPRHPPLDRRYRPGFSAAPNFGRDKNNNQ